MTFQEVTSKYNIPLKALYELYKREIIPYELNEEHEKVIEHISYVWGKDIFIRMQLAKKSKKQREKIMTEANMDLNRIELYIYNRYINSLEQGKRISQPQIINEVNTYLRVPRSRKLIEMVEKMRKRAYNKMAKARKEASMQQTEV